jgi:hypothetical protein
LLGTWRAHGSVVLEEAHAPFLKIQPARRKEATNFRLRIGHKFFVDDPVHAAREHGIEVRHELDVTAVVPPDIGEIVGECLPCGPVLLEIREAARQRMTAHIDDARVRQCKMDESRLREVVWHLVDEARRVRLSEGLRTRQILFPQIAEFARRHVLQARGEWSLLPEPPRNHQEFDEFLRTFDRRMTRENLLNERGP